MNFLKYISSVLIIFLIGTLLITSCAEDDGVPLESPDGAPEISYIRVTDPDASDSLLVSATLGSGIAIVGDNLGAIQEVWFNDRRAILTPSWVTNQTILVNVPSIAPTVITNKIYLVDGSGDTLKHDFEVAIPAPEVVGARNEWPQPGENLVISGDYLFAPVTVTFEGGVQGEVVSITQTQVEVTVPDGATEGPVTVATNFGEVQSSFHVWDSRNIVLDFDNKVGNGWRIGMTDNVNGPIDDNYLVVGGNIGANERDEGPGAPQESSKMMEYWGGNDPDRTENFYPLYPNSYRDYVMKFEAKVVTWYGGYLNFCLAPPDHANSNQEVWSNSINARAIWGPWAEIGGEFTTDGQWITVVIPMTEFQYFIEVPGAVEYAGGQQFVETAAGSLSTWMIGSPENDGNHIELYIDNIRFVQP